MCIADAPHENLLLAHVCERNAVLVYLLFCVSSRSTTGSLRLGLSFSCRQAEQCNYRLLLKCFTRYSVRYRVLPCIASGVPLCRFTGDDDRYDACPAVTAQVCVRVPGGNSPPPTPHLCPLLEKRYSTRWYAMRPNNGRYVVGSERRLDKLVPWWTKRCRQVGWAELYRYASTRKRRACAFRDETMIAWLFRGRVCVVTIVPWPTKVECSETDQTAIAHYKTYTDMSKVTHKQSLPTLPNSAS